MNFHDCPSIEVAAWVLPRSLGCWALRGEKRPTTELQSPSSGVLPLRSGIQSGTAPVSPPAETGKAHRDQLIITEFRSATLQCSGMDNRGRLVAPEPQGTGPAARCEGAVQVMPHSRDAISLSM